MAWEPTEVSLHRSYVHHGTWSANIPNAEVMQIMNGAGPLRAAQRAAITEAERYDYVEPGARTRWVKEDANTMILEAWTG